MIQYSLKKNKHSKNVRIIVRATGEITVTVPYKVPNFVARKFVEAQSGWIERRLKEFEDRRIRNGGNGGGKAKTSSERKTEYQEKKEEARIILTKRVHELNHVYKFRYGRISIRNQKTRWGSCSKSGNLNFNYKVAFLPSEMRDYVVVHELCHLKEFNHSKKFWGLVEVGSPNYKKIQLEMNSYSATLG